LFFFECGNIYKLAVCSGDMDNLRFRRDRVRFVNKISRNDLRIIAREFLCALTMENIVSLDDVRKKMGSNFRVLHDNGFVSIGQSESNSDNVAYVISYSKNAGKVPIEIRISPTFDYTWTMIKCTDVIQGYSPYSKDTFGNIMQSKTFLKADLSRATSELEDLSIL